LSWPVSALTLQRRMPSRVAAIRSCVCIWLLCARMSTVILDPKLHLQQEATLRIRIAHSRGLDQPAGPAEERTLQKLQEQLRILGVKAGGGR